MKRYLLSALALTATLNVMPPVAQAVVEKDLIPQKPGVTVVDPSVEKPTENSEKISAEEVQSKRFRRRRFRRGGFFRRRRFRRFHFHRFH